MVLTVCGARLVCGQVIVEQPICKDFNNGLCTRGAGCRYKHDKAAANAHSQQVPQQQGDFGQQAAAYQAAYDSYYGASGYGSYYASGGHGCGRGY